MNLKTFKKQSVKLISRIGINQLSKAGRNILIISLVIFLLGDLTYSFLQYSSSTLDGDMASGIVPAKDVQETLNDPFGFNVIIKNERHPNPNRFFAHFFFKEYFTYIPSIFQKAFKPIPSVYISAAFIKLLLHLTIVYLLTKLISNRKSILNLNSLIIAVLIIPLFQAYGYYIDMGIIDKSITYTFFYALPLTLLLLFFSPFYFSIYSDKKLRFNSISKAALLLLVIILPFSGALIPPIILIVSSLLFTYYFRLYYLPKKDFSIKKRVQYLFKKIPKEVIFTFTAIIVLSLYSVILGNYNSTYQDESIPIYIRYLRLPSGIYYQFTQSLGFPVLFILIIINTILIRTQFHFEEGKKIISSLKWIGLFALLYLLLLPLGGFRPYRPNILRYDTIMPITICLIYFYGKSCFFILQNIKKRKVLYLALLIAVVLIYTNADRYNLDDNYYEKLALKTIENSTKLIVPLNYNHKVLSWDPITDPKQSELKAILLQNWNITKRKKLFYNLNDSLKTKEQGTVTK